MKVLLLVLFLWISSLGHAQIPPNYYSATASKSGFELKTVLFNIIKDHTVLSYDQLYEAYKTTDTKPDNIVWDMYSDNPDGSPAYVYYHHQKKCGNYSIEGDCYNREHSFPQSWFNSASPMKTDLFHVVPTDGKVNGMRSSYPFGEVANASSTSTNGSKVGPSASAGFSGTVFEPIDAYKGDFARSYFYMATRYQNSIAGWQNNGSADAVLNGTSTSVFDDWCINLFLKWHTDDPVSTKEEVRNNAIYALQNNRNPFIDHPEFAAIIWAGAPADTTNQGGNTDTSSVTGSYCMAFNSIPESSSSYSSRSWTEENGGLWQAELARTDQTINEAAICLKDNSEAFLKSGTIQGGISNLAFKAQQKFSGSGGTIIAFVNNQEKGTFVVTEQVKTFSIPNINVEGAFDLKFMGNGETRIALDDICWASYQPTHLSKKSAADIRIYPNPFNSKITIKRTPASESRIELINALGNTVVLFETNETETFINTENLKSGIYVLIIHSTENQVTRKLLIKQ